MSNDNNINAFDAIFDRQLEELAELPAFTPPPTGTYNLTCTVTYKTINSKPAVEASFKVLDCIEQADAAEAPAKPGQEFSNAFILLKDDKTRNDFAEGMMREFLGYFTEHCGTSNIKELVDGRIKDVQITAVVKRKQDKKDAERYNVTVKDVVIA